MYTHNKWMQALPHHNKDANWFEPVKNIYQKARASGHYRIVPGAITRIQLDKYDELCSKQ